MERGALISLIIPAHNEAKYIGRCLKSALKYSYKYPHQIIVVDNASSDDTAAVALQFPGVRVVREDKKGLTHARQKGFTESNGDIVAYVDADTEIPERWFETITEEFAKNDRLVCLSGPYRYYDVSTLQSFAVALYWLFFAYPVYLCTGYMVVGGNFAARRASIEKIGGFDTSIAFYGEDTNIARRLSAAGTVKFKLSFFMNTSGRRFQGQGFFKTAVLYGLNFFSEVLLRRPVTQKYKDIR